MSCPQSGVPFEDDWLVLDLRFASLQEILAFWSWLHVGGYDVIDVISITPHHCLARLLCLVGL